MARTMKALVKRAAAKGLDWVAGFNENPAVNGRHTFVDSYLTWNVMLRAFRRWLRLVVLAACASVAASVAMQRLRSTPRTDRARAAKAQARNPAPQATSQTRSPEVGPAICTISSNSPRSAMALPWV